MHTAQYTERRGGKVHLYCLASYVTGSYQTVRQGHSCLINFGENNHFFNKSIYVIKVF